MVARVAGAVRLSVRDYLRYTKSLDQSSAAAWEEDIAVSHSMSLIGDTVMHATSRAHGDSRALTMSRWKASDPDLTSLYVVVGLELGENHALGSDPLSVAGIPHENTGYVLTAMPTRTGAGADYPSEPAEFRPAMANWLGTNLSTAVVLIRTDEPDDCPFVQAACRAVPPVLRPLLPVLVLRRPLGEACDRFLADHGIARLRPETVVVLVRGADGLVEHFRTPAARPLDGRRLAARLMSASEQVYEELKTLLDVGRIDLIDDADLTAAFEQVRELTAQRDAAQTERARLQAELERTRRALTEERRRLRQLEHATTTTAPPPPADSSQAETTDTSQHTPAAATIEVPAPRTVPLFSSFTELLQHAAQTLDRVVLSETVWAPAAELDSHKKAAVWRARTWAALVSMHEYACDRLETGASSLRGWLEAQPAPRLTPSPVTSGETRYTASEPALRQPRTFPVPFEASADGLAFMGQHVRIESGGTAPAPRLHFLDDTTNTGKIYVGYLGKHLATRRYGA